MSERFAIPRKVPCSVMVKIGNDWIDLGVRDVSIDFEANLVKLQLERWEWDVARAARSK